MILMNLLRTRIENKKHRLFALLGILVIEAVFAGYLWSRSKPGAVLGFLVKNGNHFTVAWRDSVAGYDSHDASPIDDALRFAKEELKLTAGINPFSEFELEHVWLEDRFGTTLVMWKTLGINFLNQITFNRKADALYFAAAFRQGSYSPSPFGHSILLTPVKAQ